MHPWACFSPHRDDQKTLSATGRETPFQHTLKPYAFMLSAFVQIKAGIVRSRIPVNNIEHVGTQIEPFAVTLQELQEGFKLKVSAAAHAVVQEEVAAKISQLQRVRIFVLTNYQQRHHTLAGAGFRADKVKAPDVGRKPQKKSLVVITHQRVGERAAGSINQPIQTTASKFRDALDTFKGKRLGSVRPAQQPCRGSSLIWPASCASVPDPRWRQKPSDCSRSVSRRSRSAVARIHSCLSNWPMPFE